MSAKNALRASNTAIRRGARRQTISRMNRLARRQCAGQPSLTGTPEPEMRAMCLRPQAAYDACDNGFNTLRKHAGGCGRASVVHAPRCAIAVQAAAAPQCEYARSSPQTCLILPRVCSYLHARLIQPGTHAWLQAVCRHAARLVIGTGIPACRQAVWRHVAGLVIGHWHPACLQAVLIWQCAPPINCAHGTFPRQASGIIRHMRRPTPYERAKGPGRR